METLDPNRFALLRRVARTITERRMLAGGERLLVAVSGGLDSLSLLDILHRLLDEFRLELAVFHFDHRLRPASGEDAEFVAAVAARYGIPFFGRSADVAALTRAWGASPEEGARRARYEALEEAAAEWGADLAALGHTADDRVETFLLRLLAGAGTRGLGSIQPRRGMYIRPLIDTWRRELEEHWAPGLPFPPRLDPTNRDENIPRNRVRHRLLPLLEREYNPSVREVLLREAEILSEDGQLLSDLTLAELAQHLERKDDNVSLELAALTGMGPAARRRAIQAALELAGVEAGFRLTADVLDKVAGGESGDGLDLPGGRRAERVYERLLIAPQEAMPDIREELLICGEGVFRSPALGLELSLHRQNDPPKPLAQDDPWLAALDADRLTFPLLLRAVREGDRFRPLGLDGTQKVQDFLVNLKVPRRERRRVAVLESAGEIVWLVGYRISDSCKVTSATRRVVIARARAAAMH